MKLLNFLKKTKIWKRTKIFSLIKKYEKVPEDHPLVKQINEYGSTTGGVSPQIMLSFLLCWFKNLTIFLLLYTKVEKIPDLYTTGQLRKNPVDWREKDDDDDDDVQSIEGGNDTSKQKKSQGAKKNKKRVKTGWSFLIIKKSQW